MKGNHMLLMCGHFRNLAEHRELINQRIHMPYAKGICVRVKSKQGLT
jgi:hypothetical protein